MKGIKASEVGEISKKLFDEENPLKLSRTQADILKVKLLNMEERPVLGSFRIVQEAENVSAAARGKLRRAIKVYDVDDVELKNYIDLF